MERITAKVFSSSRRDVDMRRKNPAGYAAYLVPGSHSVISQVSALKAPQLKLGKRKEPDMCKAKGTNCKVASHRSLYQTYSNFMRSAPPCRLMRYVEGEWVDLPTEMIGLVRKDFDTKRGVFEVNLNGHHLLLDFLHMAHLDVNTGSEHPMAWIDEGGICFFPEISTVDESCGQRCQAFEDKDDLSLLSGTCGQHEIKLKIDIDLDGVNKSRPIDYYGESNPLVKQVKVSQNVVGLDADIDGSCDRMSDSKVNEGYEQLEKNSHIELQCISSEEVMIMLLKDKGSSAGIDVVNLIHTRDSMLAGRIELFQKQIEITKNYRGSASVRFAWLPVSKEAFSSIMSYGVGPVELLKFKAPYGMGAHLVAADCSSTSAKYCDDDKNGIKHMALCRVILGNMEVIEHGSKQFHPSCEKFDSGADNIHNPHFYVIWSMNVSTHIYPEFVVSFKVSPEQKGFTNQEDEPEGVKVTAEKSSGGKSNVGLFPSPINLGSDHRLNPTYEGSKERAKDLNSCPTRTCESPWMTFPMLFAAIADEVSSDNMRLIIGHYRLFRSITLVGRIFIKG